MPRPTELEKRFDIHFPRMKLLDGATPVSQIKVPGGKKADTWVKHDNETSYIYGGNKVRKLEYLLGDAGEQDCNAIVTVGGFGSHHVLATSLHGQRFGFEVHALLARQSVNEHVVHNLQCDLASGATLYPMPVWPRLPALKVLAGVLRHQGKHPYIIRHGGSQPIGVLGYVDAGLELADQVKTGTLADPHRVVVALGSGGTAAGLAIGFAAAGLPARVHAVRSTPRSMVSFSVVKRLIRDTVELLRAKSNRFPAVADQAIRHLDIDHTAFGKQYGVPTVESARAMVDGKLSGLELDPTYSSKAFAVFSRIAKKKKEPLLFWHTYSSADMSTWLHSAPPPPKWVGRLPKLPEEY